MKSSIVLAAAASLLSGCGGRAPGAPAKSSREVRGDPAAATPAVRPRDLETYMVLLDLAVYKSKVAPAFDKYVTFGDSAGVRELMPGVELPRSSDRKSRLEAALKASSSVVEAKCLVRLAGVEPYQLGGGSELVSYLYSASDWLRETLTSKDVSDLTLDYPLGEHTEIIRPADAAEIRVNARNVLPPEDATIKRQLAALLTMMDAASGNPNFALALVMK